MIILRLIKHHLQPATQAITVNVTVNGRNMMYVAINELCVMRTVFNLCLEHPLTQSMYALTCIGHIF